MKGKELVSFLSDQILYKLGFCRLCDYYKILKKRKKKNPFRTLLFTNVCKIKVLSLDKRCSFLHDSDYSDSVCVIF